MKRNGVLCGLGGVLAGVLLVTFMAFNSRPVEAQAPQGVVPSSGYAVSPQPAPVGGVPQPVAPSAVQAAEAAVRETYAQTAAAPAAAPVPQERAEVPMSAPAQAGTPPTPPGFTPLQAMASAAAAPSPGLDRLRSESIEDLLNRLKAVKVQKAELERSELELVALLKEKIREQKQQMQTLGIAVEEGHVTAQGHRGNPQLQR